jgi:ERCC4-type nuclease
MILVDERTGSKEFLQRIRNMGCDAELAHLDAADFAFSGNGDPLGHCPQPFVGIERKTIPDLVDSMRSRRLQGAQHVRMSQIYDETYLLIEGIWRRSRETGLLETFNSGWRPIRGNVKYAEVDAFLCSAEAIGSLKIFRTSDEDESVAALVDRYRWWQKEWKDHKSFQSIYAPEPDVNGPKHGTKPRGMFVRRDATLCERIAAQLPGVDSKAVEVARYFGDAKTMITADEASWRRAPGVGRIGAKKIVEQIGGLA